MAGRVLVGINSGLNAGICSMYLTEISPVKLRGAIGSAYQLVITISILVSQILGLDMILGTEKDWPWLYSLIVIPAIFQLIALPFCPESPKYLMVKRGNDEDAQKGNFFSLFHYLALVEH